MFLSGLYCVCVHLYPFTDLMAGYRLYSVHIYVSFSKGNKTTPILSIGNQTNSRKDARACINFFFFFIFHPWIGVCACVCAWNGWMRWM